MSIREGGKARTKIALATTVDHELRIIPEGEILENVRLSTVSFDAFYPEWGREVTILGIIDFSFDKLLEGLEK